MSERPPVLCGIDGVYHPAFYRCNQFRFRGYGITMICCAVCKEGSHIEDDTENSARRPDIEAAFLQNASRG